ncbi:hypothetical protein BKA65DRAFT_559763 [Rhexocercosporidium sp. MPI-PUGE-AT-0058]|nr:hypothetical protein BKA65DRAFT_559763 [Rhexocercosporidium sp. MPI-PUGE-AT-0058]
MASAPDQNQNRNSGLQDTRDFQLKLVANMATEIMAEEAEVQAEANRQRELVDKYKDSSALRHRIMERCRTEKELILLGANKFKNPWSQEYRERKINKMLKQGVNLRQMKKDIAVLIASYPDPNFRNNSHPSKPALVFEVFPKLPTELRLKVWSYLVYEHASFITLDTAKNKFSKIVQAPSRDISTSSSIPVLLQSKNVLLHTTREARQQRQPTRLAKLVFTKKAGDIVYINHLKSCAASLSAATPDVPPNSEFGFMKNITTLTIHDKNFFLWGLGATNEYDEFAKVADILSKFTGLTNLWIVLGTSNCKLHLGSATMLEKVSCKDHEKRLIKWSTRAFTFRTLRTLFNTYSSNHPEWKVPELTLMRVSRLNNADTLTLWKQLRKETVGSRKKGRLSWRN